MKTFLILLCSLGALFSAHGKINALQPPPGQELPLPLQIVTLATPSPRESYAIALLQTAWPRLFGTELQVVSGQPPAEGGAIILAPDDPFLGEEGYEVALLDGDLVLSGGTRRGVIHAVIALLEEDLGVRWYVKGEEPFYPDRAGEAFQVTPRRYIPVLQSREPLYSDAFQSDFELRNRLNQTWIASVPESLGGSWNFPASAFVHTFDQLVPASLFATHPEYFALINGQRTLNQTGRKCAQLCLTNPALPGVAANTVLEILGRNPHAEIISISPNDGTGGFCQCPDCEAFYAAEGMSGAVIDFVNKVTAIVNQSYPELKTETLAYMETYVPPATIRPAPNVYIRLCTDTHAWRYSMFAIDESSHFANALSSWQQIGAKLLIWDYVVDFSHYLRLRPNLWVTDRNLDILLEHGARGILLQGAYQSPGGASAPMYVWIQAKRLWNPAWQLDDLIADFCEGYYGPAADAMKRYVALQKSEWQAFHDRNSPITGEREPRFEFSDAFLPTFAGILQEAYAAIGGNALYTGRLEREELNYLYMRLEKGPTGAADIASFRADLARFATLVERFRVTHVSENGSDQIANQLAAFECNITDTLDRPVAPGSVRICPHSVYLWPVDMQVRARFEVIDDRPLLVQPGGTSSWCMQWHFKPSDNLIGMEDYRGLIPGRQYRIRLVGRADAEGSGGALMSAAYYNIANPAILGTVTITSSQLDGENFVSVTGAPFTFQPNGYFYVTPVTNPNCRKIYFDYMEIIPVESP